MSRAGAGVSGPVAQAASRRMAIRQMPIGFARFMPVSRRVPMSVSGCTLKRTVEIGKRRLVGSRAKQRLRRSMARSYQSDVAIVGGGIAGVVCALQLLDMGKSVALFEREGPERLGGSALEAFGGMFFVI